MKTETKTGRFIKGLVVGALVGTAVGLLVAPQPGKKTRDLVQSKTGSYVGNLRRRLQRNSAVNGTEDHAESRAKVSD